jgi:hypothetical protein
VSVVESVKAEFHKSPLLAASAVAAVVGAVVLVTRHGTSGTPLTSPLDSAFNPQANLPGGGGGSGGGGAGLGQGDPAIGVPTQNVPVQTGTVTSGISAADVAAAINQAVSGLSGSLSDSQSQLQGEINQLAGAISRSQSVNEAPRTPVGTDAGQWSGLLDQLFNRLQRVAPQTQIAAPSDTATPVITAAPRTVATDGQSLFGQSQQTISDFQAAFGGGAAQAWVQQHEQELLQPKKTVLAPFNINPAPLSPPPANPTGGLISNPIPGVDYGSFVKAPPAIAYGVARPLPQPQQPLPNVDYGPPSLPGPEPLSPQAQANETAFAVALQTQNPVRQQSVQPKPSDVPTTENPPARAQTSHPRFE